MTSSSLFTELAMALKRTINIPINPYQSQNNKTESSCASSNTGNGVNLTNVGNIHKDLQNREDCNTDLDKSKTGFIKEPIEEIKEEQEEVAIEHFEEKESEDGEDLQHDGSFLLEPCDEILEEDNSVKSADYPGLTLHHLDSYPETIIDTEDEMEKIKSDLPSKQYYAIPMIKPDLSRHKYQPPAIHPDITIEQIKNPRPVKRRKSCFLVGNPGQAPTGEALEINTMFDSQKKFEIDSSSSKNPSNKRKSKGRRESILYIGEDPQMENRLMVLEVKNSRKRRKSMPLISFVEGGCLIENLSDNAIVETVNVENLPQAKMEENMEIHIDAPPNPSSYSGNVNPNNQPLDVCVDDNTAELEKLSVQEKEDLGRLRQEKINEVQAKIEIADTNDQKVHGNIDSPECLYDASKPTEENSAPSLDIEVESPNLDSFPEVDSTNFKRSVQFPRQRRKMLARQVTLGNEKTYGSNPVSPPCITITGTSSPPDGRSTPPDTLRTLNYDTGEEYKPLKDQPSSSASYEHNIIARKPFSPTRRRPDFSRQRSLDHRAHLPQKSKGPSLQRQNTLGGPPPMIRITDVDSESDEFETNTTLTFGATPEVETETHNETLEKSLSPTNADCLSHKNHEDPKSFLAPVARRSSMRRQGSLEQNQKSRRSVMIIRQKSLDNRLSGEMQDTNSNSSMLNIRHASSINHPYGKSNDGPLILEFGKGFNKVSHESTLSRINSVASDVSLSRVNSVIDPEDMAMMENEEKEMENLKTFLQSTKRAPVLSRQRSLDQRSRRATIIKQKSLDQRMQSRQDVTRQDSIHLSPGGSRSGSLATTPEGQVPSFETAFDTSDDRKTLRQYSGQDQRPTSPYGSSLPDASLDNVSPHVEERDPIGSPSRRESLVRQNSGLLIINAASNSEVQQNIGNFLFPTRKSAMMTRQRSLDCRPTTTRSRRPSLCRITRQKSLDQRHESSRPQSRKSSAQSGKDSVSSGDHSGPSSRRHSSKISVGPNTSSSSSVSAFSSNYSSTSATHGSLSTTTDSQSRKSSAAYGMSGSLSHSRRSSSARGSSSHLPRQISMASTSSDMIDSRRSSASYGSFASRTCSELRRCSSTDTWSSSSSCLNRSRYIIIS